MGTWGYGPFDNDDSGDMVALLTKPIRKVIAVKRDYTARYSYNAARAAAQVVLLAHGTDILGDLSLEIVTRALVRMRKDVEWLSIWSEPHKAAEVLDSEIDAVMLKMSNCMRCSWNGNTWEELHRLTTEAAKAEVPKKSKLPKRKTRIVKGRK